MAKWLAHADRVTVQTIDAVDESRPAPPTEAQAVLGQIGGILKRNRIPYADREF